MRTIVENEILKNIISRINTDLYDFEDASKLRIVNKSKPGYVIVIMEFDLTDQIGEFIQCSGDFVPKTPNSKLEFESNTFDYIVLSMAKNPDTQSNVLVNMPLFELVVASEGIIADESGKHNIEVNDGWSLNSSGWSLLEVE